MRVLFHLTIAVLLTAFTQIGGVVWLVSRLFRRKWAVFFVLYIGVTMAIIWVAPKFGRVAMPCFGAQTLRMQSPLFCALNRNYVTPDMAATLDQAATQVASTHRGAQTLLLDANFPFFDGFPLLPHLSHDDGRKADIAFYYRDKKGYLPGATRSPIGYFAFEQGPTNCASTWTSLRWDMDALQPLWRDYEIDPSRTKTVLRAFLENPKVGKVFLEPHLQRWLGLSHPKLRFQGCRAARHDDHIHVQLK